MKLVTLQDPRQFSELRQKLGGNIASGRILSLIQAAGCQSALIEEGPSESEYEKECQEFYDGVLAVDSDAQPVRLHFFEGEINSVDDVSNHDERYFGYCDLRPPPLSTISGALIDARVFVKTNTDYLFLICQKKFEVSFPGGRTLNVRAFPYVQQDGSAVRCAQAALASIAQFYGSRLRGPDFTAIGATYPLGQRSLPSPGLQAPQIGMGIAELDFEPVIYDFTAMPEEYADIIHPEQIIYRYVESGIPVLIGVDAGRALHALVVIGHTFTPDSWLAQTKTSYYGVPKTGRIYHCSTNWVERFVVQDDNLGPYMLAPSDFIKYFACKLAVVPLPQRIYLLAEEAERFAASYLYSQQHSMVAITDDAIAQYDKQGGARDEDTQFWYSQFREHVQREELVLRTSLLNKAQWLDYLEKTESYSSFQDIPGRLPWPDHVWLVEISWPDIFVHGRRCAGELVIDPTTLLSLDVPALCQAWLWFHAPGVILWRNAVTNEQGASVLGVRDTTRSHRKSATLRTE